MDALALWLVLTVVPLSASSSLEGLYISSSASLLPDVLVNGRVQTAYEAPGQLSDEIDFSSVLQFYMWVGPNWHNQTLYLVVQTQDMIAVPLYYDRAPDASLSKRISDSIILDE